MGKGIFLSGVEMLDSNYMKIEPLYKRMFCNHQYTGGFRKIVDYKGRKRYARICVKCGKRDYAD